jgi:tetratricopeptide (TPR) repeat protein
MMAESYLRKGEKVKALEACDKGLECLSLRSGADRYFLEGNKFMILGEYENAVFAFSGAHIMRPESGMIKESLEKAKRMLGKEPKSKNRTPSVRF